MKLKEVQIDAFGGLTDCKAKLKPGLNVIYGKNGAGKSTFFSFLKICFYGFSRGEREKFLPWSGLAGRGSVLFEQDDEWMLQVKFGKTSRSDTTVLYHHLTGEETPLPPSLGRTLFSVGEETFLKTACVAQGQLEISSKGKDEIAEKLANLENTGESGLSYAECKRTLNDMQGKLRAKRGNGGLLNEAERKTEEYKDRKKYAEEESAKKAMSYRRMEEIQSEMDRLNATQRQWADFERWQKKKNCLEYEEKRNNMVAVAEGENEEEESYETTATLWKQATETLHLLQGQNIVLPEKEPAFCSEEDFARIASSGDEEPSGLEIVCWILAAVFTVASLLLLNMSLVFFAACFIILATYMLNKRKTPLWKKYGYHTKQEFSQRYTDSLESQARYEWAVEQQKKQKEQIQTLSQQIAEYKRFGQRVKCHTPDELFSFAVVRREERRAAAEQVRIYDDLLNRVLEGHSREEIMQAEETEQPRMTQEEIHRQQLALIREKEQIAGSLQAHYEDSPEFMETNRREWEQKRDEYRKKEKILNVISDVMESAYQKMEQQFGGNLNLRAGEWLMKMTGGEYGQVRITRNYEVKLFEQSQMYALERFSGGLYDQTYLAFRLAMTELMGNGMPLFLDDALMQYDDVRTERTMDALVEFSEKTGTQILLFTCRDRELQLAKQRELINYIEIL